MVVKRRGFSSVPYPLFESRAVLDGSQTWTGRTSPPSRFESRAVLDGSQTEAVHKLTDTIV